ncbi:MAG: metal-dependent hydrolase [Candidatus Thorarchaeota archaeon]
MRGESHLSISVLMALPTWYITYMSNAYPLWQSGYVLVLFGIAMGSLLPDLDASDAKVMHGFWRPIGLFGKYLFYKPVTRLLGTRSDLFQDEHRGFLHSILGCTLVSFFFAIVILLLNTFPFGWFLWWLWIGIPIGFLFHLAEDSFTKSGVRWLFPRGEPTRSTTRFKRGSEYFLVMGFYTASVVLLTIAYVVPPMTISIFMIFGATLLSITILHRINPRISRLGDSMYLPILVEEYLIPRGGIKIDAEDSFSFLSIEEGSQQYIAKIPDLDYKWGLDREWLPSNIEATGFETGTVIELQTVKNQSKNRTYYVVKNDLFHPFMELLAA